MPETKTPLQYLKEDAQAVFDRLDKLNRDLEAVSFVELKEEIRKATADADSVMGGVFEIEENGL